MQNHDEHSQKKNYDFCQLKDIDIRKYPDADLRRNKALPELSNTEKANAPIEITLGDLHANPAKLLNTLAIHGVISMESGEYEDLCRIMLTDTEEKNSNEL